MWSGQRTGHLGTVLLLWSTVGCGDEIHVQMESSTGILVPCEKQYLWNDAANLVLYFQYFSMLQIQYDFSVFSVLI